MRPSIRSLLTSTILLSATLSMSAYAKIDKRCSAKHAATPAILPVDNYSSSTGTATPSSTFTSSTGTPHKHSGASPTATSSRSASSSSASAASSSNSSSSGNAQTYSVTDRFAGSNFFDGFTFDSFADPTHGNVNYLTQANAFSEGLAYVQSDGVAVMKVDNTTTISAGSNRNSVRISSKNSYTQGLIVLDVQSMPAGCGVWPAFWTVGNSWPNDGEIDILEGVNNNVNAQYTLHTAPGCTLDTSFEKASISSSRRHPKRRSEVHSMIAAARGAKRFNSNAVSAFAFTGKVLTTTCDATIDSNAGCAVEDPDNQSYGSALNANGGGVFAALLDGNGVAIWFFARDSIPNDLASQSPQPSTWGSPKAFWSSSLCPTKSFFGAQRIVINTTLCGDWAGSAYSSAGCPGTCAQQVANPANFDTAQWKINSVTVYN